VLDLIVRGARLFDGSGGAPLEADVGVAGDRITDTGDLSRAEARVVVDGRGLAVAPGFVDIHTHYDLAIDWPGLSDHCVRQGITTVVGGNCGIGDADVRATLERAARARLGLHVAQLAPFGPIRSTVVDRALGRAATSEEGRRTGEAVERALDAGALGLSFGPYHANSLASTEELAAAARALVAHGAPLVVHRRDEGAKALEATDEVLAIARDAGCRLQVSHLKIAGRMNWPRFDDMLRSIERARASGLDVACDVYPYEASLTYLNAILPSALKGDGKLLERLASERGRAEARAAAEKWFVERQPADRIVLITPTHPAVARGSNLVEAAKALGLEPAEAALTIMANDPKAEGGWAIYRDMMKADHVETALELPDTAIASDSVPEDDGTPTAHPRCYGTFARALARAAAKGELALADAVRRATSLPCERVGLKHRGLVAKGASADLVIFDTTRLRDAASYTDPQRYPEGIVSVIVAGKLALDRGEPTGARAGSVLTG
jgi:N-acyl-D-amino-acid deacylase